MIKNHDLILCNQKLVIGDGSHVKILGYQWIPNEERLTSHDNPHANSANSFNLRKVKDLTVREAIGWDLIQSLWDKEIADKIMQIPLGGRNLRGWESELWGHAQLKH